MIVNLSKLACLLGLVVPVAAFDYDITSAGSLLLTDVATSISPIITLFVKQDVIVTADGLEWAENDSNSTTGEILCETFLDGVLVSSGTLSLDDVGRELPTSVDCGTVAVPEGGRYKIEVTVTVDASSASTSGEYEAFAPGVAILPLVVILFLAVTTNMVEFSLYAGIFVGSCIVYGTIAAGFKNSVENYILTAIANTDHAYVYLFTFFLSGVVAMMERSGGMIGFTKALSKFARTPRGGQWATFAVGVIIFFDDYANTLLAGQGMRPLMDSLCVSREKLSFFVDATAAPIASLSPVSSWIGFEVGLIQEQLDRIVELQGTDDIGIETSGYAVFLQSVKYRYYPIFMLVLIMVSIHAQRDFGTMLIAERKTEVYKRTDGGDGSTSANVGMGEENQPRKDQPLKTWNMVIPISLLIFLIFFCMVRTGNDGSGNQTFMDKIEASNSFAALLWSTAGTTLITLIFYLIQITRDGQIIIPDAAAIKELFMSEKVKQDDPTPKARSLMSLRDSMDSFLIGVSRVFPATIVLTLAWASGSIMTAVGCDRLFAAWIVGGLNPQVLPTLSFLISLFMALATGTSWGTMSILFPLLLVPTYEATNGDPLLFYSTVAGVLSGSVAGDHMSPISDTTVLSALASECGLMNHVGTQAPYAVVAIIISTIVGTVPIGFDAWPNWVGLLLGLAAIIVFVYFFCKPVLSPTGAWDPFISIYIKLTKDETLEQLQQDTIRAASGEDLSASQTVAAKKLEDNSEPSVEENPSKDVAAPTVEEVVAVPDSKEALATEEVLDA